MAVEEGAVCLFDVMNVMFLTEERINCFVVTNIIYSYGFQSGTRPPQGGSKLFQGWLNEWK